MVHTVMTNMQDLVKQQLYKFHSSFAVTFSIYDPDPQKPKSDKH